MMITILPQIVSGYKIRAKMAKYDETGAEFRQPLYVIYDPYITPEKLKDTMIKVEEFNRLIVNKLKDKKLFDFMMRKGEPHIMFAHNEAIIKKWIPVTTTYVTKNHRDHKALHKIDGDKRKPRIYFGATSIVS
jgi:hypothetical protein